MCYAKLVGILGHSIVEPLSWNLKKTIVNLSSIAILMDRFYFKPKYIHTLGITHVN